MPFYTFYFTALALLTMFLEDNRIYALLNKLCIFLFQLGFQIAVVQGGIRDCGDRDYPGIFVRLDEPAVLSFIQSFVNNAQSAEGERPNM